MYLLNCPGCTSFSYSTAKCTTQTARGGGVRRGMRAGGGGGQGGGGRAVFIVIKIWVQTSHIFTGLHLKYKYMCVLHAPDLTISTPVARGGGDFFIPHYVPAVTGYRNNVTFQIALKEHLYVLLFCGLSVKMSEKFKSNYVPYVNSIFTPGVLPCPPPSFENLVKTESIYLCCAYNSNQSHICPCHLCLFHTRRLLLPCPPVPLL